jgi:hypothetical protein
MNKIRLIIALGLLLAMGNTAEGQDNKIELGGELGLANNMYWRGSLSAAKPCIQPGVYVASGLFRFDVWSSWSSDYFDLELTPTLTLGDFELSIIDYYEPEDGESNSYFNFLGDDSKHSTELVLAYYANKLPVNVTVATFFLGDENEETGKPYWSTYFEVGYPYSFKWFDAEVALGATPADGYYAEKTAWIHSSLALSKEFELSKQWTLPVNMALSYNPHVSKAFFTCSVGFNFN